MTLKVMKTLKVQDKIYMYFPEMNSGELAVEMCIIEVFSDSFKVNITKIDKSRVVLFKRHDEYFTSPDLCYIEKLKHEKINISGTIRKYESNIRKAEKKLLELEERLDYKKLKEQYPEEFI